jgi:hypothetical protein
MRAYPPDIESPIDIDGWRLAQVSSFCFAVHLLHCGSFAEDHQLRAPSPDTFPFETAPWTTIEATDATSQPEEYSKLAVILHTLANKVVGVFAARLLNYLAHERALTGWIPNGTSLPPLPNTIPFSSFMDLPEFFAPSSVEKFSLCHVPKLATPSFFEGGKWTGYSCFISREMDHEYNPTGPVRYSWDGIGGDNDTVRINNFDQPPRSLLNPRNKHIERYARFKLTHWIDERFSSYSPITFRARRRTTL